MTSKEIPISIRAYAKLLHVDEKAVRKAISEGKLKKGYDKNLKKILPGKADAEWGNIHKTPRPQRGVSKAKAAEKMAQKRQQIPKEKPEKPLSIQKKPVESDDEKEDYEYFLKENFTYAELIDSIKLSPNLPYTQAIRLNEILKIAGERMKLEELQGLLLRKVDVEKNLFKLGDSLKKALLNIPARCIDDIMAAPNKIDATNILTMELTSVLKTFAERLQ